MKSNLTIHIRERFMDPWSKDATETWPTPRTQREGTILILSWSVLSDSSSKASFTFPVHSESERKRKIPTSSKKLGLQSRASLRDSLSVPLWQVPRKELWLGSLKSGALCSPVSSGKYMHKVMLFKMGGRDSQEGRAEVTGALLQWVFITAQPC